MTLNLGSNLEPFTTQGRWWLPEQTQAEIGGTLTFDSEGRIVLSLVGILDEQRPAGQLIRYPVVMGRISTGEEVTLSDCTCIERHNDLFGDGNERESISVRVLFLGALLPEGDETSFDHVTIEFENLNAWMARESLINPERDETQKILRLASPTDLSVSLPVGQLRLSSGMSESYTVHSVELKRRSLLSVELGRPMKDTEAFDNVIRPLQHFFTFACDAPCQIVDLGYGSSEFGISGTDLLQKRIVTIHSGDKSGGSDEPEYSMLFLLGDVQDDPEGLFQRWFRIWEPLSPALDLLYGTQLGPKTYLETRFLLLAQAAEVYSRLQFPEQQRQNRDHRERRKRIVASVPNQEDQVWLNKALTYYHEPTFREKLEGLMLYAGPHAADITRPDFAEIVKFTRNYFTHYDDASRKKAITSPGDLNRLADQVMLLLTMCLLRNLEFDEGTSWQFLIRTPRCRAML